MTLKRLEAKTWWAKNIKYQIQNDNHKYLPFEFQKGQGHNGWKIPNTWYYVDNTLDQLYDSQKNTDKGRMGENIPNT